MNEDFQCILKLTTGEEVLSTVSVQENDGDTFLLLYHPVTFDSFEVETGESFVRVNPWMEYTQEDLYVIRFDKVVTMTENVNPKILKIYKNYLLKLAKTSNFNGTTKNHVPLTEDIGFISSVDEARDNLEKLFNLP